MEEREVARLVLGHSALTFDKRLINQDLSQNYENGINLYRQSRYNQAKNTHLLTKDYPTLRNFSNPYTDSLIKLNPDKVFYSSAPFQSLQQIPSINFSKLSNLALSLNNPYFFNLQEVNHDRNTITKIAFNDSQNNDENVKFLTLLNDLKTLYIGPSFTDRVNESRSKKLYILMDYFSKHNEQNDLKLDDKGCLIYRNLTTNTKFVLYVDYFIKYPNEARSSSLPLYFRELFLDKILNSQNKFIPILHYKPQVFTKKRRIKHKKKTHQR